MKKSVYLETSFFSFYHDERPQSARRRQITQDWWNIERHRYELVTSYVTLVETAEPVYPTWEQVHAMASKVALLQNTPDISGIVQVYMDHSLMPAGDTADAIHLASASFHGVDYLLTWNCKHLANANKYEHIQAIHLRLGLMTPMLITPEQLFREEQ